MSLSGALELCGLISWSLLSHLTLPLSSHPQPSPPTLIPHLPPSAVQGTERAARQLVEKLWQQPPSPHPHRGTPPLSHSSDVQELRAAIQLVERLQQELSSARQRQNWTPEGAAFAALERKLDELEAEGRGREERWRAVLHEARGMADAHLEMSNRKW